MTHEEYMAKTYGWMNEDQQKCFKMLCDLFHGEHHVFGIVRASGPRGIYINSTASNNFATFDFNQLTRAVVMAHDRMIRFEICPSGPGMLKLFFHKRYKRGGIICESHPTIESAILDIRQVEL